MEGALIFIVAYLFALVRSVCERLEATSSFALALFSTNHLLAGSESATDEWPREGKNGHHHHVTKPEVNGSAEEKKGNSPGRLFLM